MKILFIIPSLAIGGQEKIGMMLTSVLMKYHEVVTVCFEPENPQQFNYKTPIIRIVNKVYKNRFLKFLNVFKRVITLRKIKRSYKPDVSISIGETAIIANAFTFTSECKIASMHQSIKFFTEFKSLYKKAYQLHDKIIPVSSGINDELKQFHGINNSLFIHNGYDIDAIMIDANESIPEEMKPFFNGNVIAHLGRFDLQKGYWHLVMLFVLVKKEIPGAKLLLIGNYAPNSEIFSFCINYLADAGLKIGYLQKKESIDFNKIDVLLTGHRSNPFKFLSKANIFVFPSIWEGFPNALVEAMACGLPVVAADCKTGPRDILIDKKTGEEFGLLLPAFNDTFNAKMTSPCEADLFYAQQIKDLLKNESKLKHFRVQSIKRANFFSISEMGNKWLKVIEDK
jgi:glycosyltransferase involved in cell wall biosynthesis